MKTAEYTGVCGNIVLSVYKNGLYTKMLRIYLLSIFTIKTP